MTSTVLDVTVMLLCVSASVLALGGVDAGTSTPAPDAQAAADRVVTETATVQTETATDSSAETAAVIDGERGTVHTTLAELLVLSAEYGGDDGDRRQATDTFRETVIETVSDRLGPRVRLDIYGTLDDGATEETRSIAVGDAPPRSADVNTAVVSVPESGAGDRHGAGWRLIVRTW